jgi:hypothetical protein
MALKGNLRDITITQLLNLINVAQKTGTLIVEGPIEKVYVSFSEGKLAYAQKGTEDSSLAAVLHRANKISTAQFREIKERASNMSDKELGLLLINANYVTQQDILTSLRTQFLATINHLFTWVEGVFHFENNLVPPDGKITLRVNLENIIIEGARRIHELEQLQDEIPSLDIALKFADRPGADLKHVNLSVEEWRVVSYINPKNTLRQISQVTKINDLEIRRIAYALLQAGLVEFIRPETPVIPAGRSAPPKASKEEQKSLINRIISRIRSL